MLKSNQKQSNLYVRPRATKSANMQMLPTRQFLLTNTRTTPSGHLTFRIPLQVLHTAIPHIGDFPYAPSSVSWDGPTMFMKGEHSRYLNKHNIPVAKAFFPNMRLEVLDTGHWVHAEKPAQTVDLIDDFVKSVKD
jgi:pimeloyl-ACP methyl ester carboxylesterase